MRERDRLSVFLVVHTGDVDGWKQVKVRMRLVTKERVGDETEAKGAKGTKEGGCRFEVARRGLGGDSRVTGRRGREREGTWRGRDCPHDHHVGNCDRPATLPTSLLAHDRERESLSQTEAMSGSHFDWKCKCEWEVKLEYIDKASYIDGSVTQKGISPTALVMLLRPMLILPCCKCKMYQWSVMLKDPLRSS